MNVEYMRRVSMRIIDCHSVANHRSPGSIADTAQGIPRSEPNMQSIEKGSRQLLLLVNIDGSS